MRRLVLCLLSIIPLLWAGCASSPSVEDASQTIPPKIFQYETDGEIRTSIRMVHVPPGQYEMGNTHQGRDESYSWCDWLCEGPRHTVTIEKGFYIGETEVTQSQWEAIMGQWPQTPPAEFYGKGPDHPAYFVSWYDAQRFLEKLTERTPGEFRLPSEAEWEYVCRGPASNPNRYAPFFFGDDGDCHITACNACDLFDRYMIWCGNSNGKSAPVASVKPNPFGVYDIVGNVMEWCEDTWHETYEGAPADGSAWTDPPKEFRVVRGGWYDNGATVMRSAYRGYLPPDRRDVQVGFRVVFVPAD